MKVRKDRIYDSHHTDLAVKSKTVAVFAIMYLYLVFDKCTDLVNGLNPGVSVVRIV